MLRRLTDERLLWQRRPQHADSAGHDEQHFRTARGALRAQDAIFGRTVS